LKRKGCGKKEEVGEFSFIDLHKTETLLEGEGEEEQLMKISSHVAVTIQASGIE
jgi:hypothetical protein